MSEAKSAQNNILRGLIPRLTKSCGGVSDPAEQSPAGYQVTRNKVLRGIKPLGTTFKYEYFR
jgi:hypothetical protein